MIILLAQIFVVVFLTYNVWQEAGGYTALAVLIVFFYCFHLEAKIMHSVSRLERIVVGFFEQLGFFDKLAKKENSDLNGKQKTPSKPSKSSDPNRGV